MALRTRGVDVVEGGRMRSDQLDLQTREPTLAAGLLKLRPLLPEDTVFGGNGVYAWA